MPGQAKDNPKSVQNYSQIQALHDDYPPLLKSQSRTKLAPYKEEKFHRGPSDSIGNNFSPNAEHLNIHLFKNLNSTSNNYHLSDHNRPGRPIVLPPLNPISRPESPETRKKKLTAVPQCKDYDEISIERYRRYLDKEIPVQDLQQIEDRTWLAIQSRIPRPLLKEKKLSELRHILRDEIRQDFLQSQKEAILNYILTSENERIRLRIKSFPSIYHPLALRGPVPWHESKIQAVEYLHDNLFVSHPILVSINQLFRKYETMKVVETEDLYCLSYPLSAEQFLSLVKDKIKGFRSKNLVGWLDEVLSILSEHRSEWYNANVENADKLDRFFGCISSLLSRQFFLLCENSLANCDKAMTKICRSEDKFLLFPSLSGGKVVFKNDISSIIGSFASVFDLIADAFSKIPALETRLFKTLANQPMFVRLINSNLIRSKLKDKIVTFLSSYLDKLEKLIQPWKTFENVLTPDFENVIKKFFDANILHEIDNNIVLLCDMMSNVREISDFYTVGPFRVNSVTLKKELFAALNSVLEKLSIQLRFQFDSLNSNIKNEFSKVELTLSENVNSTSETMKLLAFIKETEDITLVRLQKDIETSTLLLNTMMKTRFTTEKDYSEFGLVFSAPLRLKPLIKKITDASEAEKEKALQSVIALAAECDQRSAVVLEQLSTVPEFAIISDYSKHFAAVTVLNDELDEIGRLVRQVNEEQQHLKIAKNEFLQYRSSITQLEPYYKLWKSVSTFFELENKCLNDSFDNLDPDEVDDIISEVGRQIFTLTKNFPDVKTAKKVIDIFKNKFEMFREYLPLIQTFGNKNLKERHWKTISEICGIYIQPGANIALFQLLPKGIMSFVQDFIKISESATREQAFETSLKKMKDAFDPMNFDTVDYRDSGTQILSSVDDIQALLDDQIVRVQSMRQSPFVKHFEIDVLDWEKRLLYIQDLIDVWLQVQSTWLYLEPIFGSEDIVKQMPKEAKLFKIVDSVWRKIMNSCKDNSSVIVVSDNQSQASLLKKALVDLEQVQKGLNDYLEMKRLFFPRFFFLSNDELLEILSETKDPLRVQPHLKKCFEGIAELKFQEGTIITAMISAEKEIVKMKHEIDTNLAKGAVEKWLLEVETVMKNSVHDHISRAVSVYSTVPREKFVVDDWPGQVVLTTTQIYWTLDVENALKSSDPNALAKYRELLTQQLESTATLVRGELTSMSRATLSALCVIDVHARDLVAFLEEQNINDIYDFEWISQLRYYWQENDVAVQMMNASIKYGHEYLGNSPRLVITPLTDRCYRTVISALDMNLYAGPEGPAGTGKTETTKDLAKALAKQCVVFNCSDGLDYIAMGKFFKGLASSGSWACFDEFNRINLEVLSVVAQQVLTIQRGVAAKLSEFVFEGTTMKLNHGCAVFITMNPGYAGRSELPDNLKALFRPVAMMVPDYTLIAEISLYSCGYLSARSLSRKIVATFKLCSEQLSSQDHYDYGMRAVKAVLVAAGNLKIKYPNEEEQILLLRSINDTNLSKFLQQDVPLFRAITSDLFPGVTLPESNYEQLALAIQTCFAEKKLIASEKVVEKVFQTFEMMRVRHGFMLVGDPDSGKTSCYHILQESLDLCKKYGHVIEKPIKVQTINPKAITMGQLYGQFDPVTHEWSDGVIANVFRNFTITPEDHRKWVVFDGPVDAIWIENMNTVLDDNKKLCLTSGEIIQLTASMSVVFEVRDLAVASPATVSRCGMIFFEPSNVGWEARFRSWIAKINGKVEESAMEKLSKYTMLLIPSLIDFSTSLKAKFFIPRSESELIVSYCNVLDCYLKLIEESKIENYSLRDIIVFAAVWSFGSCLMESSKNVFEEILRENSKEMDEATGKFFLPSESLFSFQYSLKDEKWIKWLDETTPITIPPDVPLDEVIVPTIDYVRYSAMFDLLLRNDKPIVVVGPSGTGKSVYLTEYLISSISRGVVPIFVNFSAQTSANQTQDLILSKLDKRKKGVMGPPMGKKAIVFVDDLNMPLKEKYGAQPPIELIRQALDSKFWFDLKDTSVINLVDLNFVAAMGPPGGGRQHITPRALRHFHALGINEFDQSTMFQIFSTVLKTHFKRNKFSIEVSDFTSQIISGTLNIYRKVSDNLLPTPSKAHYLFNLRDVSRIIRGILLVSPGYCQTKSNLIKLWVHETNRVFCDRLSEESDQKWFTDTLNSVLASDLNAEIVDGSDHSYRELLFSSFTNEKKSYEEVTNLETAVNVLNEKLEEYNALSKKPLDLVIFKYAIVHIAKVVRVLQQQGHILLVGVGGSGRQSIAKVAAYVMGYTLFQIELTRTYSVTEWKEDLKKICKLAGMDGKPVVFLFSDTQVKYESFFEDLNNLLNTGDVPNLFALDEKMQIAEAMRQILSSSDKENDYSNIYLFNYFLQRCRRNLHVVLCMSPVGEAFRNRLRLYPSVVNCCTIDWFDEWPEEALEKVARKYLEDVTMSSEQRLSVISICKTFHKDASRMSDKFYSQTRRKTYITPTFYLDLLKSFKQLLNAKKGEINSLKNRYQNGLIQLESAASQVGTMQIELNDLKPVLVKTTAETEEIIKVVEKETIEVDKKASLVKKDEEIANKKADAAKIIRDECEADLSLAIPALESALNALDTLKPQDITLVKSMKNPPGAVKLVLEAICVMKDLKPIRVKDAAGKMVDDYWPVGQKMLGDPRFLASLKEFDKDNISPKTIQIIRQKFVPNEDFKPEIVKNSSSAAEGLCRWVLAMETYEKIAKVVAPKKEALKAAESELEGEMVKLRAKQAELKKVQDKLDALKQQFEDMNTKKLNLEAQMDLVGKKLQRAEKLISGLGGEKDRWTDAVEFYKSLEVNVLGDILISAAVIVYFGPFTSSFRNECITRWMEICSGLSVATSIPFHFIKTTEDSVQMRAWILNGLPNDSFSKENALISQKSRRYPLFIDPQGQANRWIRNMEKNNNLVVIKLSSDDYLRQLETSVQYGKPVLLENVGEEIDSVLEPLLSKQFVNQNGADFIQIGDSLVEVSKDFRFYITSKLRNPHYLPELAAKLTIINFMITPDGLQDQLLGIVAAKEKPDLEETRNQITVQSAENKKQLKEIEDKILEILSSSSNILEDETAVHILSSSKVLANDIAEKQKIADETEVAINKTRMGYFPVSKHATVLFFVMSAMSNIDPMYQNSLAWFINLFIQSIESSKANENIDERVKDLKNVFTLMLYRNICQSIFKKDKLLFSFLLACSLAKDQGEIIDAQWNIMIGGAVKLDMQRIQNPFTWISNETWKNLENLQVISELNDIILNFKEQETFWKSIYDEKEPHSATFPSHISDFSRFLILKILRPDKVVPAARKFVESYLGAEFTEPPPFDLPKSFADSKSSTPLMFILSPGADPTASLYTFAAHRKVPLESISMGQGQGVIAEALIKKATREGSWVLLQNVHLAVSWMTTMEKICEGFSNPEVHTNFRLWLTTYPSDAFPISILQNSIKLVNEPPNGLKANLLRCYTSDVIKDDLFKRNLTRDDVTWKRFLFSLCFFHAVIQERKNFGPLGWNIPYEFNETDLSISAKQLYKFLTESEKIPLKALRYVTGECNYGGRCTDGNDRILLGSLLEKYYNMDILNDDFRLTDDGEFKIAPSGDFDSQLDFIRSLPSSQKPNIFGLHENGLIVRDLEETRQFVNSLLLTQSHFGSGAQSGNIAIELAKSTLEQIPPGFDVELVRSLYPVSYEESMNTVLTQEVIRFNRLLRTIRDSLQQTLKGLKGQIVLSSDLEKISNSLIYGKVPDLWLSVSYPSLLPLSGYVANLVERCRFFSDWIDKSSPIVFDISYFFFTQAFVTGVMQNYARKMKLPIDLLMSSVFIMTDVSPVQKPEEGAYIKGLKLEGARWNDVNATLDESYPKQLSCSMPVIHLVPVERSKKKNDIKYYKCPVYRTSARRGTLSTTGHSTNFVMTMDLPTDVEPSHWTNRGVALMLESNVN